MSSFFSSDGSFSLQFAIIFVVIFLILAGVVFAFRRLTGKGMTLSKAGPRGRQPRLGIVDIYELDRQRQLILLRRDNVEHLLLVGGPNDVVIERNINRSMGARLPTEDLPDPDALLEPAPAYEAKPAPYLEPSFEMPVVVPTPPPGSPAPVPSVARPLDDMAIARAPEPIVEPAPEPTDVPAPRRPASRLAGAIRRTPPSLVNLVPGAAALRGRPSDEVEAAEDHPAPVEPVAERGAPPSAISGGDAYPIAPPVVPPAASRTIDAAILSDMARQLEEALRRPAAAVRSSQPGPMEPDDTTRAPVPARAEPILASEPVASPDAIPSPDASAHPEPEPAMGSAPEPHPVDPIAAAMAASLENPVTPDHPPAPADSELDALFDEREPEPVPFMAPSRPPEPVHAEPAPPVFVEAPPAPPAPAPEPQPAPAAKPIAEPAAPAKPAQASPNPFSVEEIEAEFARLLGRPLDRKT